MGKGRFDGILNAGHITPSRQTVDDGLDRLCAWWQASALGQMHGLSCGDEANESLLAKGHDLSVWCFVGLGDDREGDHETVPRRKRAQFFHDTLRRIAVNLATTLMAGDVANFCKKEPEVVGGFRCRSDGGSARAISVLARDGDGRWDSADVFGIGLLKPLQELPRVSGKTLDVTSLPLRIERIKRQAALAAAAQAAEDH